MICGATRQSKVYHTISKLNLHNTGCQTSMQDKLTQLGGYPNYSYSMAGKLERNTRQRLQGLRMLISQLRLQMLPQHHEHFVGLIVETAMVQHLVTAGRHGSIVKLRPLQDIRYQLIRFIPFLDGK